MKNKKRNFSEDEDYVYENDSDEEYLPYSKASKKTKAQPKATLEPTKISYISESIACEVSEEFKDYFSTLKLKKDHELRPIWITPDNLIYLEAFSPIYQQAYDFLVAIAEPESRPEYIHTYKLTENSLYSAVAVSIDSESIILVLNRLCKTEVPHEVIKYIKDCTSTFGKAKIVLKDNSYFIESKYPEILRELLKNPTIRDARSLSTDEEKSEIFLEAAAPEENEKNLDYTKLGIDLMDAEDDDGDILFSSESSLQNQIKTLSFMIKQECVHDVKRSAKDVSRYPLLEEYDFKIDRKNPLLEIDLRPSTKIRPYQEKSLSKMFGNGRARSGIIVLPCGAGKSLTGVTAASTIKKPCIIMCINNASVKQWKEQFILWTNVSEKRIKIFTSGTKEELPPPNEACIVISTYSMICHTGTRSTSGEKMINSVKEREWGLMILDEVHVAPADMFQKVIHMVNSHCKLGLTATLVREDNKIKDLSTLVGPKLYEANWIDLTLDGYLAKVKCIEIWCPMTKEFFSQYISKRLLKSTSNPRVQRLLYTLNPSKIRTCEYLVKYHKDRGDKIIIFSDDVPALILYCEALKPIVSIPYIYGGTSENDRRIFLTAFKTKSDVCCIGLSKVGDTALDIPEANVIIQVSSHFGARRQEAQRLGRILRPKPNPTGEFNAFFYTLISTDTREMYFSSKRQQYLIDQGYTFKVIQNLSDKADQESIVLDTKEKEINLLNEVLEFNYASVDKKEDSQLEIEHNGEVDDSDGHVDFDNTDSSLVVKRKSQNLSALSGAGSTFYTEFER